VIAGRDGILSWDDICPRDSAQDLLPAANGINRSRKHSQHGGRDGLSTELVEEICDRAHDAGISVHMDGARIFNAAAYLKDNVAAMTRKCDSVQFCLSKGLGAGVGSMIVASREFIERSRSIRKMLGGGMRQAGILAAAGMIALEEGPKRLWMDHDRAKELARGLARIPGIELNVEKVQTNIVIFGIGPSGITSADFLADLKKEMSWRYRSINTGFAW
jgi:threonine aldolase